MIICCAIANIMCCANTNNYVIMYMRVLLCHRICSVLLATCFLKWFRNFYFNLTKLSFIDFCKLKRTRIQHYSHGKL